MEKTHEKMTLEEYKTAVRSFWLMFETLMVDAKEDEIYYVETSLRTDINPENILASCSGVYKKIENIRDMIYRADDVNYEAFDDYEDEDLSDLYYWTISKHRLVDNEYEEIFRVNQYGETGYLDVYMEHHKSMTEEERRVYKEWERLDGLIPFNSIEVEYPYKRGDLLKLDNRPYSNTATYFVYYGDGMVFRRDHFGMLTYDRLISAGGVGRFTPYRIEIAANCPDAVLKELSFVVADNTDEENEKLLKTLRDTDYDFLPQKSYKMAKIEQKIMTKKEAEDVLQKLNLTLDEYKKIANRTKKLFMNMFAEPLEPDEVYFGKSHTRYDVGVEEYQEIFHSYDKMIDFIRYESSIGFKDDVFAEPLHKVMWWNIEKKKLFGDSYKTTMCCTINTKGEVVDFKMGDAFYDRYRTDERYRDIRKGINIINLSCDEYLNDAPSLEVPFKVGDVLYADRRPRNSAIECIYLGEKSSRDFSPTKLCLVRETFMYKDKYLVTSLETLGELRKEASYYSILEKREAAMDPYLARARDRILMDNSIVDKIVALADKGRHTDFDFVADYFNSLT